MGTITVTEGGTLLNNGTATISGTITNGNVPTLTAGEVGSGDTLAVLQSTTLTANLTFDSGAQLRLYMNSAASSADTFDAERESHTQRCGA